MLKYTSSLVFCIVLGIPGLICESLVLDDLEIDNLNSPTPDTQDEDELSLAYDKMCKTYWKSFEESNGQYIESIESLCLLANIKPHNHDDILEKKKSIADRMANKREEMAARNTEL